METHDLDDYARDNVLLVCDDTHLSQQILEALFLHGCSAVGPVATGALALSMAATTSPTIALVARPPRGRRTAVDLAAELARTWGVVSFLLAPARSSRDAVDRLPAICTPRPGQASRLAAILSSLEV
jgi:hypothetical protein